MNSNPIVLLTILVVDISVIAFIQIRHELTDALNSENREGAKQEQYVKDS